MQLIYDTKNNSGSIGIISFKPQELPASTRDAVTRIGVEIPKERLEACYVNMRIAHCETVA